MRRDEWDWNINNYKVPAAWAHYRFGSTRDPRGQPLRHMEQLLLVTSCDLPAGIGASLRTDGQCTTHTGLRMDTQASWNLYFRYLIIFVLIYVIFLFYFIPICRNFYNWTWNYRKDSDIVASYGPSFTKLNAAPPFKMINNKYEPGGFLQNT